MILVFDCKNNTSEVIDNKKEFTYKVPDSGIYQFYLKNGNNTKEAENITAEVSISGDYDYPVLE